MVENETFRKQCFKIELSNDQERIFLKIEIENLFDTRELKERRS